ncbi:MAG: hypothetical protein ACREOO_12730 [bacterium]
MKTRVAWLLLIAAGIGVGLALASKRDTRTPPDGRAALTPFGGELVLSDGQRLEIALAPAQKDSFAVEFRVAVSPAQKFQRHRCLISGNSKYILKTTPLRRWALQGDTLMVLSEISLTLRAHADSSKPLVLKLDFVNLDAHPEVRGTATLTVAAAPGLRGPTPAPATVVTAAKSTQPDTAAEGSVAGAKTKSEAAPRDTTVAHDQAGVDGASAQTQLDQALEKKSAEHALQEGQEQLWVPIAFLLLGIALIALLSIVTKVKSREARTQARSRLKPLVVPAPHREPGAGGGLTPEAPAGKAEAGAAAKSPAVARGGSVRELLREHENLPVAQTMAPPIDLFAEDLDTSGGLVAPASLQTAMHKLRNITTDTQKALAVQCQALEQFARHTESVRGFLLEGAAPQENATVSGTAPRASKPLRNGHGQASEEGKPAELSLRVVPAEEQGDNFEEVASAIDVLIAASEAKPLVAPAAAMSQKIDSLRRIGSGLQDLAGICRALALAAPLADVENLARKVQDLQMSCEAWKLDQSVKLSFSLPRSSQTRTPARREIVDAIVDSLHETRKIAVQGPIYFERRLTQLVEYDLPKLRQQFKEIENEEMRRLWEEMVV